LGRVTSTIVGVRSTQVGRRPSSRDAIVDAAVAAYGESGPAAVSLRDIAQRAGVTHPLIVQYFGSKDGLVECVGARLVDHLGGVLDEHRTCDAESIAAWLGSARKTPSMTKLLVRTGLGDFTPAGFPAWLRRLGNCAPPGGAGDWRAQICRYAAASLVLGWLTFDRFMITAVRLGNVSEAKRDRAVAGLAAHLLALSDAQEPPLAPRRARRPRDRGMIDQQRSTPSSRDKLLASAVELIAARGPAAVSIRDVANHAGLNHGLLHRHFGSKDALIAEALDVGIGSLLPGALDPDGFDIDEVVEVLHHDPAPARLIARVVVDDIDIRSVRLRFPVIRALLEVARNSPATSRPAEAADPRIATAAAAAMVGGSAVWGSALQQAWRPRVEPAAPIAELTGHLLGVSRA
jgi:AcrR family transcriptional regulator